MARFGVLALIAVATMINYLDRTALGIAAPGMTNDLHLSPAVMGIVFSAFSWSYTLAQIPGGWVLDRIGTRLTYFLAVFTWSAFTLVQGFTRGLSSLLACRLGLGVSEAPCFPTNSRVVAVWFPVEERAQATAVYTVGEYLGLACFGPLLFWISRRMGWRALFFAVGAAGIAFAFVWWALYRERDSTPQDVVAEVHKFDWRKARELLRKRQVWGASLGQFGGNSTLVFFLTWFPTYLAKQRHMDWMHAGFSAMIPFLSAACGECWLGGDRILCLRGRAREIWRGSFR